MRQVSTLFMNTDEVQLPLFSPSYYLLPVGFWLNNLFHSALVFSCVSIYRIP